MKTLEQIQLNPGIKVINTGGDGGAFKIRNSTGQNVFIIASYGGGWDHVSASLDNRCPTWDEMCKIKNMFFNDDEIVLQYHPAKSDYINIHPYCLHLWRPQNEVIICPPKYMI